MRPPRGAAKTESGEEGDDHDLKDLLQWHQDQIVEKVVTSFDHKIFRLLGYVGVQNLQGSAAESHWQQEAHATSFDGGIVEASTEVSRDERGSLSDEHKISGSGDRRVVKGSSGWSLATSEASSLGKHIEMKSMAEYERAYTTLKQSPSLHRTKSNFHWLSIYSSQVIQHRCFELGVVFLIFVNAASLGIQADWTARNTGASLPGEFTVSDVSFTVAFVLELSLRLFAARQSFFYWKNPEFAWNLFDFLLVGSAIAEMCLKLTSSARSNVSAFRLLRILRLTRVMRVVKVARFFQELRIMVLGIVNSMKSLMWTLILLFLITYCFAIVVLQFVAEERQRLQGRRLSGICIDNNQCDSNGTLLVHYYGSLVKAMYTLFQCISGGVSWKEAADPLTEFMPVFGCWFCLYVAFSVFCVLNIVTGIFVENAVSMTALDEDQMLLQEIASRKKWIEEVKKLFQEADEEDSGELTWERFAERLQNVRIQHLLKKLGLDVAAIELRSLFDLFDSDGNGSIEIIEFATALQRFNGTARGVDIAQLRNEVKKIGKKLHDSMKSIKRESSAFSIGTPQTSRTRSGVQASARGNTSAVPSEVCFHLRSGRNSEVSTRSDAGDKINL